jgi:integrase
MRQRTTPAGFVDTNDGMLRSILKRGCDDMPKRYQNPKLEKRTDVAVPYWFIRVRVADPSKKRTRTPLKLGFCHEMNQKEAMKARGEVLHRVNAGLLIGSARLSFRELVEQFETARLPQFSAPTGDWYKSLIHTHILPAFGDRQLADIDAPMIEAWLTGKERDGKGWWLRKGLRGCLSNIFATAKEWKLWTGDNPASAARIGRKVEVRDLSKKQPLTAEQLRAILAAVSESTRFVLLIATLIGLRISEIMGLRWSDVDLEAATLIVERRWYRGDLGPPKTPAAERTKRLGPLVNEFGRRYPGPHKREQYIFLGDDGLTPPDERDMLRNELRPALKRLKLHFAGFGWHQFRRLQITLSQTEGGATPLEAQKGAGHSRVDTTMAYTLIDANRDEEQVTRMFNWLMGPGEGSKQ